MQNTTITRIPAYLHIPYDVCLLGHGLEPRGRHYSLLSHRSDNLKCYLHLCMPYYSIKYSVWLILLSDTINARATSIHQLQIALRLYIHYLFQSTDCSRHIGLNHQPTNCFFVSGLAEEFTVCCYRLWWLCFKLQPAAKSNNFTYMKLVNSNSSI